MSSYLDDDEFDLNEKPVYKGIRFCPDCNNMLHPKEDSGKLAFECLMNGCKYEMVVTDTESAVENLVSRKEFQQEKNLIIDTDFGMDPTMPKEEKECPNCGHNEAVFMISSDIEDTKIVLIYICANSKCGHCWNKVVEE